MPKPRNVQVEALPSGRGRWRLRRWPADSGLVTIYVWWFLCQLYAIWRHPSVWAILVAAVIVLLVLGTLYLVRNRWTYTSTQDEALDAAIREYGRP